MKFFSRKTLEDQRTDVASRLEQAEQDAQTKHAAVAGADDIDAAALAAASADIKLSALRDTLADVDAKLAAEQSRLAAEKRIADRKEAAAKLNALADDLQDARAVYMGWLTETFVPLVKALDGVNNTQFASQLHDGPHNAAAYLLDREMRLARDKATAIERGSGDDYLRHVLGRRI